MKTIIQYLSTLLVTIILLGACDEPVTNFELKDQPPKIVLNASFSADSIPRVHVSHSFGLDRSLYVKDISGLQLDFLENGNPQGSFVSKEDKWFQLEGFIPKQETKYVIEASAAEFESVETSFFIPDSPEIIKIDTAWIEVNEKGCLECSSTNQFQMKIVFEDKKERRDYYVLSASYSTIEYEMNYETGEILDSAEVMRSMGLLSSDNKIELSMSGSYYYTFDPAYDQGGDAFIFSDRHFNMSQTGISVRINNYSSWNYGDPSMKELNDSITLFVSLKAVDENFYRYAQSKAAAWEVDGNPLAEPVSIFSNVEAGFGLVTGFSSDVVEIPLVLKQNEGDYNHSW